MNKQTNQKIEPTIVKHLCMQNVATISAGNSELVGSLIAEALAAVGADGVLSIETSNSLETSVEVQEGMEVDRGFISPQFVTNHVRQPSQTCSGLAGYGTAENSASDGSACQKKVRKSHKVSRVWRWTAASFPPSL